MEENGTPRAEQGELQTKQDQLHTEESASRNPREQSQNSVSREKKQNALLGFLMNILRGAAIGIAFIIPGFSGGSVAAILGVYEKLVESVAGLFKKFKESILFLLPIAIGMLLGIAALVFPIQWGLSHYPVPTVTLFAGLSLGGLPSVTEKTKGGWKWEYLAAFLIPCAAAACLAFLPIGKNVDLFSLDIGDYLLLVLIGAVGACALVVPGISGSMLLLIFGYYTPLIELVTKHLLHGLNVGTSVLVLFCTLAGMIAGFFGISFLMKFLLKKFPRGTFVAILGFILGSIPTVYVTTVRNTPAALSHLYGNPWYWVVSAVLLLLGAVLSYALYRYSKKRGE